MSRSPKYKLFDPDQRYVASCKEPELAVRIAALLGEGAKVRVGGKPVFTHVRDADQTIDAAALALLENEAALHARTDLQDTAAKARLDK